MSSVSQPHPPARAGLPQRFVRRLAPALLALLSSLLAPSFSLAAPASAAAAVAPTYPPLVAPSPPGPFDLQLHDRIGLGFVGIQKMSEMPANRDLSRATHPELYAYLEAYGMQVRRIGWTGSSVALWLTQKQPFWRINAVGRLLMQAYPNKYRYFESDQFVEFDLHSPITPRRAPPAPESTPSSSKSGAKVRGTDADPEASPNDPGYAQQWHYHEDIGGIRLPGAWTLSQGKGVTVAIVDSGARQHRDLRARLSGGYDLIAEPWRAYDGDGRDDDATDPGDTSDGSHCARSWSSWHGTHVAGTVAASAGNARDGTGVAPLARLVPVRAMGVCGGAVKDIADSIRWAAGVAVPGTPSNPSPGQVINLSIGTRADVPCDADTQVAIDLAREAGATVVVAAGNFEKNVSGSYPANCKGVIAVAATNRAGGRASYSNWGPGVALAAPGGECTAPAPLCGNDGVFSTLNTGRFEPRKDSFTTLAGTSMAAPHVTGVVALMKAVRPDMSPDEAYALLTGTARAFPGTCLACGAGLLDAEAAVSAAKTKYPLMRESEGNGQRSTADRVAQLPMRVLGRIVAQGGKDWFVMNLPAGATLSATLQPNAQSNLDLAAFDTLGSQVAQSTNPGKGEVDGLAVRNDSGVAADYYVRVSYVDEPRGTYTLDLRLKSGQLLQ
ncbi:S8 family peptidase [Ideonella sp. 4Y16]|uniref:S8 family serine peptidase n=1 Tax=Ideonella alba TaxID=2824118 RepID=UPI001B38C77C|nr:S8 family serine peptidase [Ideonella alba]MBQ0946534.1 S8 family peptidase [Ideonella alba]